MFFICSLKGSKSEASSDYLSALEAATPTIQAIAVTDYYILDALHAASATLESAVGLQFVNQSDPTARASSDQPGALPWHYRGAPPRIAIENTYSRSQTAPPAARSRCPTRGALAAPGTAAWARPVAPPQAADHYPRPGAARRAP
jgi:hypothetical protein